MQLDGLRTQSNGFLGNGAAEVTVVYSGCLSDLLCDLKFTIFDCILPAPLIETLPWRGDTADPSCAQWLQALTLQ